MPLPNKSSRTATLLSAYNYSIKCLSTNVAVFLELLKLQRYGISDKVYFSQPEIQISTDFMPVLNNFHVSFNSEQHLERYNAANLSINHATLLIP
jgi:hypothetical protein